MKTRRHHNNKGTRQIRRGKTADQVKAMATRLGLPFRIKKGHDDMRPHIIDLDELLEHLRIERWETYASSSDLPKQLEVMMTGQGFRVTVRGVETYRGQNASDAVNAYNEAR